MLRAFALALYLLVAAAVAAQALARPEWNFDAVGYVGAALEGEGRSEAQVHRLAYDAIAAAAPESASRAISGASDYREALAADAHAFAALLPIYRFKWGYVVLVRLLHALGLNPAHATHVVSTLAYLALAGGLLAFLLRARGGAGTALAACGVIAAPPLLELAALSTPDMLVVLLIGAGAAAALAEAPRLRGAGVAALVVAGLVRPDAALNAVVLLGALAFAQPSRRRVLLVAAGLSVLGAASAAAASGPAEVAALIRTYFTSRAYAAAGPRSGVEAWLDALAVGLRGTQLYHPSAIGLWAALAMLAAWRIQRADPLRAVLAAAWVTLPLRFLLFPDRSDRFFAPSYALTGLAFLVALQPREAARPDSRTSNG